MKPFLILLLFIVNSATGYGEVSLDLVLSALRKQSVAANTGDIKAVVATVPSKGIEILRKGSDESVTMKREGMATYLESYFKTMRPQTYLYGVRLCSVDKKDAQSITVTLEVMESYELVDSEEVTTSSYRESVVLGLEEGEVVFLRASMDEQKIEKLKLAR